jgi:hypothetical protein
VELVKHLRLLERQSVITGWHDRNISAGTDWKNAIDDHLESAEIILLLISADFLASDYCFDIELKRAMERHAEGKAREFPSSSASVTGPPRHFANCRPFRKMPGQSEIGTILTKRIRAL